MSVFKRTPNGSIRLRQTSHPSSASIAAQKQRRELVNGPNSERRIKSIALKAALTASVSDDSIADIPDPRGE